MTSKSRAHGFGNLGRSLVTLAAIVVLAGGAARATTQYLSDGAHQNGNGGWDVPTQGTCPADLTKTTRPECLALRLNIGALL